MSPESQVGHADGLGKCLTDCRGRITHADGVARRRLRAMRRARMIFAPKGFLVSRSDPSFSVHAGERTSEERRHAQYR